jgi:hypothetical protein
MRKTFEIYVAYWGEDRKAYRILLGTSEGQRPLESVSVYGRKILGRTPTK